MLHNEDQSHASDHWAAVSNHYNQPLFCGLDASHWVWFSICLLKQVQVGGMGDREHLYCEVATATSHSYAFVQVYELEAGVAWIVFCLFKSSSVFKRKNKCSL